MAIAPGALAYKFAFQLCPIFLSGGIASLIPGQYLPIIALTEALNLPLGLISGSENIELDAFFANYIPQPGATIIDNQVAEYPFANQAVAANALIQMPLMVSMRMICPARNTLGYAAKTATMLLLQTALQQHNQRSGTYTIITPSYFYTNCIMLRMTDVTSGQGGHQAQVEWQMEFRQPLLTAAAAAAAQNSLMSKLTSGGQINGDPVWSGANTSTGSVSPLTDPTQAVGATTVGQSAPIPSAASIGSSGLNDIQPFSGGSAVA